MKIITQLPSLADGSVGGCTGGVGGEERVPSDMLVELQVGRPLFIFPVEHHVVYTQSLPTKMIEEIMITK